MQKYNIVQLNFGGNYLGIEGRAVFLGFPILEFVP
jgi:hypothetical protein